MSGTPAPVPVYPKEEKDMKVTRGETEVIGFPHTEMKTVLSVMRKAEKAGDIKALQWSARRIAWLYQRAWAIDSECETDAALFNEVWREMLKTDPVPNPEETA